MYKFLALLVVLSLVGCRPCETCTQPNGGFVESCTAGQYSHENRCYDHVGYIYHFRYYIPGQGVTQDQVPERGTEQMLHSFQECEAVKQTTHESFESNSQGVLGTGRYKYTFLAESCDEYFY